MAYNLQEKKPVLQMVSPATNSVNLQKAPVKRNFWLKTLLPGLFFAPMAKADDPFCTKVESTGSFSAFRNDNDASNNHQTTYNFCVTETFIKQPQTQK